MEIEDQERLLSKKAISKQITAIKKRYEVDIDSDKAEASVHIYRKGENSDNYVAKIEAEALSENVFCVDYAGTSISGLGKFLYYMLLDEIYPAALICDRETVRDKAFRIWKVFERLDYVETGVFEDEENPEENTSEGYYNKTARFKL